MIQFSSVAQLCPNLCDPMDCSMSGFPVHHQLPELAQICVFQVGDAIQPSHLLFFPYPFVFSLSQHQGLFYEPLLCIRWPKYWSFNFSISLSNEYSGPISFRIDWFDLLAVQGTLKSLLQHHSSKHQFFGIQHSLWSNSHSWQIDGETMETVRDFILGGSKITADGDCSHEIKRCFLLERKIMINLDSILKSRDITLPTKIYTVKDLAFPVIIDRCESWTMKKPELRRIDVFELWCWRRLLRVPWTARRSNQSVLKEINPEYSLEGLMLKTNTLAT